MNMDSYIRAWYLKLIGARFFISVLVILLCDIEVGSK